MELGEVVRVDRHSMLGLQKVHWRVVYVCVCGGGGEIKYKSQQVEIVNFHRKNIFIADGSYET